MWNKWKRVECFNKFDQSEKLKWYRVSNSRTNEAEHELRQFGSTKASRQVGTERSLLSGGQAVTGCMADRQTLCSLPP